MKNVFRIINKNIKLLLRSKSSALIIILAPLLVILLVGIAFDNANTYGLTVGVLAQQPNENTQAFVSALSDRQFKVLSYDVEQECVEDIKLGLTHTCVLFPPDFNFESNVQQQVTFYVDYSKINLVYMIMDTLGDRFFAESSRVSKELAGEVLDQLSDTKTRLSEQQASVSRSRTESLSAQEAVSAVSGNLNQLNLDYPAQIPIVQAQAALGLARQALEGELAAAERNATQARQESDGSSATSEEKDDVKKYINRAISSIDSAQQRLDSGNESLTAVGGMLSTIYTDLTSLQERMGLAKSAVSDGKVKLAGAATSLNAATAQLEETQNTISTILANIDGIRVTDPNTISAPITTDIRPVAAQTTYLNYLFPSLIMLVLMFIAILLGTTLVMIEKHSPAHFRNFTTPIKNITFVTSTYLTNIFLVLIQVLIIIGIAAYFFSAQILPQLHVVVLILLLSATLFSLLGMAIGYVFTSEETGTLAAISTGSIMLFMSSVIIPIESMPAAIRQVATYNPFVISERLLRSSILFRPSLESMAADLFILLGVSVVLFLAIWGGQVLLAKHPLERFTYARHKRQRAVGGGLGVKVGEVKSGKGAGAAGPVGSDLAHDYVRRAIKQGLSQKQILEAFQKAGYSKGQIRELIEEYKKRN